MTRRLAMLALLVSATFVFAPPTEAAPLSEAPRVDAKVRLGEMRGVVTGADDGLGIRKVKMTLRRDGTREVVSVKRTGRNGAFTFDDLPRGVYSLEATAVGFLPRILAPILVQPGKDTRVEHISLTPEPAGRSDS
ncbi:MAG: carboxypeptidase-like regulatory domain-containing protein [Myxococcota bacterium]